MRPHEPAATLLLALALCNDVVARALTAGLLGDPTEVALWRRGRESGFDKATLERGRPPLAGAALRLRTETDDHAASRSAGLIAYTKGAPESVLACCSRDGDRNRRGAVRSAARACARPRRMAQDGLRVLAVACRRWDTLPAETRSPTWSSAI